MTDQTVIGCELLAAPGVWTHDRGRDDSSIKSQLLRPGRMLGAGRVWGESCTNSIDKEVTSRLALAVIPVLRLLPGKGKAGDLVMWAPASAVDTL